MVGFRVFDVGLLIVWQPTRAADEVNNCPADASSLLGPWQLVSAGDGSVRPADRDGDGFACVTRVVVRDGVLLTVATDNAACTSTTLEATQ